MKFLIILLMMVMSSGSFANERTMRDSFDNLYWHEYNRYTLVKISEDNKINKFSMSIGNRFNYKGLLIYPSKIDVFVDLEEDAMPWFNCREKVEFLSREWFCEIHIMNIDEMKTANWSKQIGHPSYPETITGKTTRLH